MAGGSLWKWSREVTWRRAVDSGEANVRLRAAKVGRRRHKRSMPSGKACALNCHFGSLVSPSLFDLCRLMSRRVKRRQDKSKSVWALMRSCQDRTIAAFGIFVHQRANLVVPSRSRIASITQAYFESRSWNRDAKALPLWIGLSGCQLFFRFR